MRTVISVLGMLLFVSCAVLILVGWRNPSSRFLVGFVQTRDADSQNPLRTAAAACWLLLGFAAGSLGLLVSWDSDASLRNATLDSLPGSVCAVVMLSCFAVAAWVRFGSAPPWLRPMAMREQPEQA